jgi:hypothetical protein
MEATGRLLKMLYPPTFNSVFIWFSVLCNYLVLTTQIRLASDDEEISRAVEFMYEGKDVV